ncbi:MAG: TonB-dependent receptor, partial [candidate division Zixibacteria bacterium]|nr:carboxypeptidase-like regulatory domain-containing protein [candidate division Zixibacteria bacterium]NIV07424.1 TonB-dependent receptor [candidate division Zixibacteria bacterium]
MLSLILSTSFLFSGTTGKIVGQVVDASSGEPLPGVNVVIENTTLGASTDVDGTYLILNVPPGTYSLRAIMIGYREMLVNEVRINADKTTRIDFQLKESTVELGETIEVTAERPLVKKDLTSTESVVSS